ncbi:MAG: LPXTG cell wall anchor domain-containing protein [Candidatus Nanopelagicales bacterium]|nr:LPXTG cell wall anchor domain-containing protein [Candidatus Nanopelagicales bacterium]
MKLKSIFASGLTVSLLALPLIATPAMAVPVNDNIANASDVNATSVTFTNVGSTDESSEYGAASLNSTVWYYWVATAGSATISTCGSATANEMNVYTAAEVGYNAATTPNATVPTTAITPSLYSLPKTACTNGQTVTFTATAGARYYIQILTNNGGEGPFTINGVTPSTPAPAPASAPAAATPSGLEKVTICHRTHATTNPYRLITVSTSSIVGADSSVNGHGEHNSKKTRLSRNNGAGDGIFNPPYAKPSLKYWGDIIPPFTARNGGVFPGLNWKWGPVTYSDSIFDKAEFRAISASGGTAKAYENAALLACQGAAADMTVKQFFDLERKNDQRRPDIVSELEQEEKDELTPLIGGPEEEPENNIPDQSLAGIVWLDLNRNGIQEDNEPDMPNIAVTVSQTDPSLARGVTPNFTGSSIGRGAAAAARWPSGEFSTSLRSAKTYQVTTDANGAYLFKSIGAGDWTVVGVVPAGLGVTYDSSGISDARVDTNVPVSGFAFTWVGLVGETGINAPVTNPDGSPVSEKVTVSSAGPDAKFCTPDDVSYVVTPVGGVISLDGIAPGKYNVDSIGDKDTKGAFTLSETTYTAAIATKYGTNCSKLADTGVSTNNSLLGLLGLAFALLGISSYGLYRTRKSV